MGPMAQHFTQAFGLGDSDCAYHPVDAHGVAFAAIQALKETDQSAAAPDREAGGRESSALGRRLEGARAQTKGMTPGPPAVVAIQPQPATSRRPGCRGQCPIGSRGGRSGGRRAVLAPAGHGRR